MSDGDIRAIHCESERSVLIVVASLGVTDRGCFGKYVDINCIFLSVTSCDVSEGSRSVVLRFALIIICYCNDSIFGSLVHFDTKGGILDSFFLINLEIGECNYTFFGTSCDSFNLVTNLGGGKFTFVYGILDVRYIYTSFDINRSYSILSIIRIEIQRIIYAEVTFGDSDRCAVLITIPGCCSVDPVSSVEDKSAVAVIVARKVAISRFGVPFIGISIVAIAQTHVGTHMEVISHVDRSVARSETGIGRLNFNPIILYIINSNFPVGIPLEFELYIGSERTGTTKAIPRIDGLATAGLAITDSVNFIIVQVNLMDLFKKIHVSESNLGIRLSILCLESLHLNDQN